MFQSESFIDILVFVATASIFFVWFIRYDNIKKEFKAYGFPSWFRDLVGILKISFIMMFYSPDFYVNLVGASGISLLMLGAVVTHIRNSDSFRDTVASVAMLSISVVLLGSLVG